MFDDALVSGRASVNGTPSGWYGIDTGGTYEVALDPRALDALGGAEPSSANAAAPRARISLGLGGLELEGLLASTETRPGLTVDVSTVPLRGRVGIGAFERVALTIDPDSRRIYFEHVAYAPECEYYCDCPAEEDAFEGRADRSRGGCMEPLEIFEPEPGEYSLQLETGTNPVDDTVQALGHERNGPFWEGVAIYLLQQERLADFEERIEFDPEAGMFAAYSSDRDALEQLGRLMAPYVNHPERVRALIAEMESAGFEFDD